MELLTPKSYPMVRGFVMIALILLTIVLVTGTLELAEQMDEGLWSAEHAPHPWPWPKQDRWPRALATFSASGVTSGTTNTFVLASPSPDQSEFPYPILSNPTLRIHSTSTRPWGIFVHDPDERASVYNTDYRYGYINLRNNGSIKIDREEGRAWFCPHMFAVYDDPDRWCLDDNGEVDFTVLPILSPPQCLSCYDGETTGTTHGWEPKQ